MSAEIALVLENVPLFEGLSAEELSSIAELCHEELHAANEVICRAGAEGAHLYILTSGQVTVETVTAAGEVKQLALLHQGDLFGDFAFIYVGPRIAAIRASQPCTVLVLSRESFEVLAEQHPHLGFLVMRNIALRVCWRLRELDLTLLMSGAQESDEPGGLLRWLGLR
ncbi:MAG: cyclic nucleotide-binding domain-containing protein [Armatimonadetes bacterium]|nr:cyclic nucleotide-binding domain-containing protein [Armatimonadota bacterium]